MNQDERGLMQKHLELEEHWHPLNRVTRPDPSDHAFSLMSWVVGGLAALCALAEIGHHALGWF